MPLSDSAINEVRAEIAALHELKGKIDDRLRTLEAILVPLDFGQAALPFMRAGSRDRTTVGARASAEPSKSVHSSTGLRAAIIEVLKTHGPARSNEIAAMLEEQGFTNDSTTSLTTRVYNDLWRMSKRGLVSNKDAVFSVK